MTGPGAADEDPDENGGDADVDISTSMSAGCAEHAAAGSLPEAFNGFTSFGLTGSDQGVQNPDPGVLGLDSNSKSRPLIHAGSTKMPSRSKSFSVLPVEYE